MFRNLSIVFLLLLFGGCASKMDNVNKNLSIEKEVITQDKKIETIKNEEVEDKKEIVEDLPKTDETKKKPEKLFSFDGEWIGNKTSRFLQRKLYLKQETDLYAKGYLELTYLTTSGKVIEKESFDMQIYIKFFEPIAIIKDEKNEKQEEVTILRDSKNEFRIIPKKENSIFFENSSMMFKKVLEEEHEKIEKEDETKQPEEIKKIEKKLVWQDDKSTLILKANFEKANHYCEVLKKDNQNNWRLPTKDETIKLSNSLNNDSQECYWTSSKSIDDSEKAWCFKYKDGKSELKIKKEKLHIRCVREEIQ